ncbi:MAG: PAS domain-containing protein [Alphaproteobacteria bacterium]
MHNHATQRGEPLGAEGALDGFVRVAGGLRSDMTRGLLDFWTALRGRCGGLPTRAMVEPAAIGSRILPHIFLCEYLDDGGVLIRLQGSYLGSRAYQALTGQRIGPKSFGGNSSAILSIYNAVRALERPIGTHERSMRPDCPVIVAEVLHTPLAAEPGGPARFVLGALDRIDEADPASAEGALWGRFAVKLVDPL